MSDAWIFCRVTTASGSVVPNTGPIATPADTAMPWNSRSLRAPPVRASGAARAERASRWCCCGGGSILFIEAGLDQGCQGVQRLLGIPAFGTQLDIGATG